MDRSDGALNVKDIPRILRVPGTFYWKKSGDKYKEGTGGVFKIKGIEKNLAKRYTMKEMEEAFPMKEIEKPKYPITGSDQKNNALKKYADAEKRDFFLRINKAYPIEDRPSFKALISGAEGTIPFEKMSDKHVSGANNALLITATMMRDAGWNQAKALEHITKVGWHGIEKEGGGMNEIANTIKSAYSNNYTFSFKNEVIVHNTTPEEQQLIQEAYTKIAKIKKETDKVRFTNYERELLINYPYLKKNEIGLIFNYVNGVYKMMSDVEISDLFLNGLYDDMLWNYRTKKNVADKVACLVSIIPEMELTDDGGYILNVKNGLLNLQTLEISPHTLNFVSLVQFPVNYDPTAHCPIWLDCMTAWTVGEEAEEKKNLHHQLHFPSFPSGNLCSTFREGLTIDDC